MFSWLLELAQAIARGIALTFGMVVYVIAVGSAALGVLVQLGWSGILGWVIIIGTFLGAVFVKAAIDERRELAEWRETERRRELAAQRSAGSQPSTSPAPNRGLTRTKKTSPK